jgi:hypothetical protein
MNLGAAPEEQLAAVGAPARFGSAGRRDAHAVARLRKRIDVDIELSRLV